jgi:hypothetical protein
MSNINFIENFYDNLPNVDTLMSSLDGVSNAPGNNGICVIPFGSEIDIESILGKYHFSSRKVSKLLEKNGIKIFKIAHFGLNKKKPDREGRFILYKVPNTKFAYLAITLDGSEFFHKDLRPIFKSLYPIVIYTFIKSTKLRALINRFKAINELTEIKITRASHILRFQDNNPMSAVTWPKVSLEDAFSWVLENNGWFKSIQFDAKRHNMTLANIFIDRRGIVRTNGIFELVLQSFITPTTDLIEQTFQQYSNRDRRTSVDKEAKPLVIQYEENVFENIEENKVFIQSISKIENASVSVIHGNPYIHISLIDYFDGSSYDLWVLNNTEIIIVPQMKGSVASIKRIVNHIFDTFAEGEVKEYENTSY